MLSELTAFKEVCVTFEMHSEDLSYNNKRMSPSIAKHFFASKFISCWEQLNKINWVVFHWGRLSRKIHCFLLYSCREHFCVQILVGGWWFNIDQFSCISWVYYHSKFQQYLPRVNVTSHKLRAQSHKTAPTSVANCKSLVVTYTSDWLVDKSRIP